MALLCHDCFVEDRLISVLINIEKKFWSDAMLLNYKSNMKTPNFARSPLFKYVDCLADYLGIEYILVLIKSTLKPFYDQVRPIIDVVITHTAIQSAL